MARAAILILAALAMTIAACQATMTWKSCSTSSAHCPPSSVTMSPDPAVRGKNVTFAVTCTSNEVVSGGTSVNEVYFLGIKVMQITKELCDLQPCPRPPGTHTVSGGMVIPTFTPTGPLSMTMINTDQNGQQINCIDINFNVVA